MRPVPDTIAAISTALGEGAVSLLRLSGNDAVAIADKFFRSKQGLRQVPARRASFGRIVDREGRTVDEVLLTLFRAPHSYTGEDVVEISAHGGLFVTRRILDLLLAGGARAADPGEFTQRAFLNGKMDLTQAEAVMDLIRAQSDLALRAATRQLEGGLGRAAEAMRGELIQLVAQVEAFIDFPEEDIDPDTGAALKARMQAVQQGLGALLETAERGRILRSGARTVICGAPNVGKSSLLNALSGRDRAIVSPQAGTTRDTIEELLHIHGLPFVLVDTAGLRAHTADPVESAGMERTHRELERADVILEVVDGHSAPDTARRVPVPPGHRGHILVWNKSDLGIHPAWPASGGWPLSCATGQGLDALRAAMRDSVWDAGGTADPPLVAINARHQRNFQRASEALADAVEAFEHDEAPEIVAFELREALQAVGEVSGRVDAEEVLGAIFARFCIGK